MTANVSFQNRLANLPSSAGVGFPFCHRTPALHTLHIALPSAIAAPHTGQRCSIARTSFPKNCETYLVTKSPLYVSVLTRTNLVAGRGIGTLPNASIQPARASDSMQVRTLDRGLGCNRLFCPILSITVIRFADGYQSISWK